MEGRKGREEKSRGITTERKRGREGGKEGRRKASRVEGLQEEERQSPDRPEWYSVPRTLQETTDAATPGLGLEPAPAESRCPQDADGAGCRRWPRQAQCWGPRC